MHCALYLKITNTVLKKILSIVKQIVSETQNLHHNFSRPCDSEVIDQNNIFSHFDQQLKNLLAYC